MSNNLTVYISIGNSDDKLSQVEWAEFVLDVRDALANLAIHRHGDWYSAPGAPWQNACWCIEVRPVMVDDLRARLARIAARYRQDSIAWAEATVSFLSPYGGPMSSPRLDVEALYVALDKKRRQERISGAEMLRRSGVGTTSRSVWTRLAHGEGPSADNLVRFLLWLGETDIRAFVADAESGGAG